MKNLVILLLWLWVHSNQQMHLPIVSISCNKELGTVWLNSLEQTARKLNLSSNVKTFPLNPVAKSVSLLSFSMIAATFFGGVYGSWARKYLKVVKKWLKVTKDYVLWVILDRSVNRDFWKELTPIIRVTYPFALKDCCRASYLMTGGGFGRGI